MKKTITYILLLLFSVSLAQGQPDEKETVIVKEKSDDDAYIHYLNRYYNINKVSMDEVFIFKEDPIKKKKELEEEAQKRPEEVIVEVEKPVEELHYTESGEVIPQKSQVASLENDPPIIYQNNVVQKKIENEAQSGGSSSQQEYNPTTSNGSNPSTSYPSASKSKRPGQSGFNRGKVKNKRGRKTKLGRSCPRF